MPCRNCDDQCYCTVVAGNESVSVSGSGSLTSPYAISARTSATSGNAIAVRPDGLYVPSPIVSGKPASVPWGYQGGQVLTAYTGTTPLTASTYTNLTGMSFTFTASVNRYYRFYYQTSFGWTGTSGCVNTNLLLVNGYSVSGNQAYGAPGQYFAISGGAVLSSVASSPSNNSLQFVAGTCTVSIQYALSEAGRSNVPNLSAQYPWRMWVEDIGPSV